MFLYHRDSFGWKPPPVSEGPIVKMNIGGLQRPSFIYRTHVLKITNSADTYVGADIANILVIIC